MKAALKLLPVISACAVLGACASVAPYGPATSNAAQGFSEQRIEQNRWRVSYRSVGGADMASDYALLRAAEVTLGQSQDWFIVDSRFVDGRPASAVRPTFSVGAGTSRYGRWSSSGVGVGVGLNFGGQQPSTAVLEIRTGSGSRPDRADAYDAREIVRNLSGPR